MRTLGTLARCTFLGFTFAVSEQEIDRQLRRSRGWTFGWALELPWLGLRKLSITWSHLTTERRFIRRLLKTIWLAVVLLVFTRTPLTASNTDQDTSRVFEAPGLFTSLFVWDDQSFALLDSRDGTLILIGVDGEEVGSLQLMPAYGRGGAVYPDVVLRQDKLIHWLSKSRQSIFTYGTNGKLVSHTSVPSPTPFWFYVGLDSFTVFGTSSSFPEAHYYVVDRRGEVKSRTQGWLAPVAEKNAFASIFFFDTEKYGRVEVLAYYPFVRYKRDQIIDFSACLPDLPGQAPRVRQQRLPKPLGYQVDPDSLSRLTPLILGAAVGGENIIYAVGNASALVEINLEAETSRCWKVPSAREGKRYFLSGVAATATHVAILSQVEGQASNVRIWHVDELANNLTLPK